MINRSVLENVINAGLENGADFVEVFLEDTVSREFGLTDSSPSKALVGQLRGAGIRLFYGTDQIYSTTNDLSEAGLVATAQTAAKARRQTAVTKPVNLNESQPMIRHASSLDRKKCFSILSKMDQLARGRSGHVTQVEPFLLEKTQRVTIANSQGLWVEDVRPYVRAGVAVTLEKDGRRDSQHTRTGQMGNADWFETVDLQNLAHSAVDRSLLLIDAEFAPAGEMPVVLENGFGGVIFHEACGHGLETTAVAKDSSVFCGLLGQRVADHCVTAIDDGTIDSAWGSLKYDDEGRPTQRTVLIENGILKSYIVDQMGALKTGYQPTGSGRRQNYKFAPASRMRNTFLAASNSASDTVEAMIRDIDYGLYAKEMGGGSVSPGTGDYNFGVVEGWIIRNGKLEKPVKGATLIGRGIDTLKKIKKVGNNLRLQDGMCGSVSGSIPTTVGQPAIMVESILVGGVAEGKPA